MSPLIESLKRLFESKQITKEQLDNVLNKGNFNKEEKEYILAAE